MPPRTDYGTPADAFFDALGPEIEPLARELRGLVRETAPEADEQIKWGVPVYTCPGQGTWFCSIRATKTYAALQLGAVARLDDPDGRLEGTGKSLRHVKIRSHDDLDRARFSAWIRQAAGEP